MKVTGRVCVVTGGASGIGKALCERFAAEGASGIAVVDRNAEGAAAVAGAVGGLAIPCDLGEQDAVEDMIRRGMTLDQVQAASPAKPFERQYGATSGDWTTRNFVEAVYKSLTGKK